MDVAKLLAELRKERRYVEEAILTLESLVGTRKKLRGRAPDGITEIKRRGRPPGSKNKPKSIDLVPDLASSIQAGGAD